MACFKTHLTISVSVSGAGAMVLFMTHLASLKISLLYWMLGSLGGILPDIDAPQSISARLFFTVMALLVTAMVVNLLPPMILISLFLLGIVIFLGTFYGLSQCFSTLSIHRGNFHSLLAALLFGLITTVLTYHCFHVGELIAWFSGIFVTGGYLLHLLLDELYSVDFMNRKLKASFGSALKLLSLRHKTSTLLFLLMTLSIFLFTPRTEKVVKIFLHEHTYKTLKMKFRSLN